MNPQDVACEFKPLPLFLQSSLNHYIGFYYQLIKDFYFRCAPHPCLDNEFRLTYKTHNKIITIRPTDLILNLYMRYFRFDKDQPPTLTADFRADEATVPKEEIELLAYYRQSLKASICLRNRKQGVAQLFALFSHEQLNNLGINYEKCDFQRFYGSDDHEADNVGYKILMKKWDCAPLRIYTKEEKLERAFDINFSIEQVKKNIIGQSGTTSKLYIWGVELSNSVLLKEILYLCHPDGFIYFYLDL